MDIWKHGKYIDTWSVVHFLSGFLLSVLFYKLGYEFLTAAIFSLVALVAWEGFEWAVKIIEPSINVIMDLIIGFAGFLLGAYLYYLINFPVGNYFYIILAVSIALPTWGFLDFLKRGYR